MISLVENISNWQTSFCNNDLLSKACRHIPFISPALTVDSDSNQYTLAIDENLQQGRRAFFAILTITSCFALSTLNNFALSFIVTPGASLAFTSVATVATPAAILAGIVAIGILGFKLDNMLTCSPVTNLAIKEFLNEPQPPMHIFSWLVDDNKRIKRLLDNTSVDLNKKDSTFGHTLLQRAAIEGKMELIPLLWNKSTTETKFGILCIGSQSYPKEKHQATLNFLINEGLFNPEYFDNDQQYNILLKVINELELLQKFIDIGFNIDTKNPKNQSIRDKIKEEITYFASHPLLVEEICFEQRTKRNSDLVTFLENITTQ